MRYEAWKNPLSLVTAVTVVPIATLVTTTVAPGTTPLLWSTTVPVMVPRDSWACAAFETTRHNNNSLNRKRGRIFSPN